MNGHEPLTPEERALAERLRLGPQAAPSPALDAAVLAAARAALDGDRADRGAVSPHPTQPTAAAPADAAHAHAAPRPRRLRRWSAAMGVAASLALAVGIAWQLRPLPPSPPHAAPVPAEDAAAEESGDPGYGPAAPEPAAAADAAPSARAAPAPEMAPPAAESRQAGAEELHEPVAAPASPMKALSPPKPAPLPAPAVEAPPAAAPQVFPEPASAEHDEQYAAQQRERDAIGARAAPAPVLQRRQALKSAPAPTSADAPRGALAEAQGNDLSAAPPPPPAAPASAAAPAAIADDAASGAAQAAAGADAQLPPRQWLARIRQQRDAGERDAARASLRLFRQQHPQARIPRDLRALLDD